MRNHNYTIYCISLFTIVLLAAGCSPMRFAPEDLDEDFSPASKSVEELVTELPLMSDRLERIEGRARAQISSPQGSDRATVEFKGDRQQSLFKVRNQVGIEGGRMLADRDSVLIYDRLESTAYKLSHAQAENYYLQGMTAVNLLQIIQPDFSDTGNFNLFESETSYVLVSENDQIQYYINREDLYLQQVRYPDELNYPFSEIHFKNYEDFDGIKLPVRMQIISADRDTNIILQIRSVTPDPEELIFDPEIPSDITIRRV